MIVVGHRGVFYEKLENSVQSFDLAVEIGCQRIEFDVQETKDGKGVIVHDERTGRVCPDNLHIIEHSTQELTELRMNNGDRVLSLEAFMERYHDKIELNLEIKGQNPKLGEYVAAACSGFRTPRPIIFSCFYLAPLQAVRRMLPDAKLAFLTEEKMFDPKSYSGRSSEILKELHSLKIEYIHPQTEVCDRETMIHAKQNGWKVVPYAATKGEEFVDRVQVWNKMRDLGVEGLCTNYPRELIEWLGHNG